MPKYLPDVNFGVFGVEHEKPSACVYYRVKVPLRSLNELGLANVMTHGVGATGPTEDAHMAMMTSDIALFFALGGGGIQTTIENLKAMNPGWNDDRTEMVYPPSIVYDMDDNLDWVDPFNEAYVRLGTRRWDGELMKPDDKLTINFENGDKPLDLWQDRVTIRQGEVFNVARNHKYVQGCHQVARRCDGVTTTSPYLAKYYREVLGCQSVHVYPNSIVPEDYPVARLQPHEGVRILWQGGGSHHRDWMPLRGALAEIAQKYPQAKFVIWGTSFKWVMDAIPEEQYEFIEWVPYDAYKPMRVLVDCDINLCPLTDNEFNRSKSAIKWYESTMPFRPEATLAARVAPYSDEIEDGRTGLLYSSPREFVEKLSTLIENVELRRKLGDEARNWVQLNRHHLKTAPDLFQYYSELRARKKEALTV